MSSLDPPSAPLGGMPVSASAPASADAGASLSDAVVQALRAKQLVVVELIGRGGHSVVWRARDQRLARDVAVKVIDVSRVPAAAVARFAREVSIVAQLRHPHIVPLYDAGIAGDGSLFAVMPLATGQTLREFEKRGPLPLRVVVPLVREIADALSYAHGRGIIHRDIKPENILIEDDHAVVADFGLAIAIGERPAVSPVPGLDRWPDDARLTEAGTFVGTPLYASPEQLTSQEDIDARTDVFSLGAVCYEMLTGRPPFQGDTVKDIVAARFQAAPPPMKEWGVQVPAAVEAAVLRALRPEPAERTNSTLAFRDQLILASGVLRQPSLWRRARTWFAVVAGVAALAILARTDGRAGLDTARLDPRRVVVADLDNESGDSAYARWGDIAGDMLAAQLAKVPGLQVVVSERWLARRQQTQRPPAPLSLQHVAVEVNAGTVVSGGYYLSGGHVELVVELTDARSGALLRTFGPIAVSPAAPDSMVTALGARLASALDTLVVQQPARRGERKRVASPDAQRDLSRLPK